MKEGAPSINAEERASANNWPKSEIKERWFRLRPSESFKAFVNGSAEQVITFENDDGALIAKFAGEEFFYAGFTNNFFDDERRFITFTCLSEQESTAQTVPTPSNAKFTETVLCLAEALDEAENELKEVLKTHDKSLTELEQLKARLAEYSELIDAANKVLRENKRLKTELQGQRPTLNRLYDEKQKLETESRRLQVIIEQKEKEISRLKALLEALGRSIQNPYLPKITVEVATVQHHTTESTTPQSSFFWKAAFLAPKNMGSEFPPTKREKRVFELPGKNESPQHEAAENQAAPDGVLVILSKNEKIYLLEGLLEELRKIPSGRKRMYSDRAKDIMLILYIKEKVRYEELAAIITKNTPHHKKIQANTIATLLSTYAKRYGGIRKIKASLNINSQKTPRQQAMAQLTVKDGRQNSLAKILTELGADNLPLTEKGYIVWNHAEKLLMLIVYLTEHRGWSTEQIAKALSDTFKMQISRNTIIGVKSRHASKIKLKEDDVIKLTALCKDLTAPARPVRKRHIKTPWVKQHHKPRMPSKGNPDVNSLKASCAGATRTPSQNKFLAYKKYEARIKAQNKQFFEDNILDTESNVTITLDELEVAAKQIIQATQMPSDEDIVKDIKKYLDGKIDNPVKFIFDTYTQNKDESSLDKLRNIHRSKYPNKYKHSAYSDKLKFGILRQGINENEMKQVLEIRLERGYSAEHLNALRIIIWAFKEELARKVGIQGEALRLLRQVKAAVEKYAKENGAEQIKIVMQEFKPVQNKTATYSYTYTLTEHL